MWNFIEFWAAKTLFEVALGALLITGFMAAWAALFIRAKLSKKCRHADAKLIDTSAYGNSAKYHCAKCGETFWSKL